MKDFSKSILKFHRHTGRLPIVLVMITVLISSCMPDPLELDNLKSAKPKIVVSSLILPDRSVAVLLTKSIGALEASEKSDPQTLIAQIAINDAEVTITANDSIYVLKLSQNGVYQGFDIPIVVGRECHLKVVSKSFGEVSATAVVQAPIYFDTIKAEVYFNGFNDYWAQVTYAIKDPPSSNYYILSVQEAERQNIIENILKPDAYTRILEDRTFNGQEFSEMFRAMHRNFNPGDSIAVSLANVSVDYFNYVKLRMENQLELVEVFGEPIHYPTNIRGGSGFFNLHLTDIREMVL